MSMGPPAECYLEGPVFEASNPEERRDGDSDGRPVVIDLDNFATGPREWDLIQTAIFYDRLGWHTREEYEAFTKVYGYDIMQWPGYPMLADIRELIMTTWVIQKAGEGEKMPAEARKRIDALRTGASRKDWLPF
jgi:hypothetical protein